MITKIKIQNILLAVSISIATNPAFANKITLGPYLQQSGKDSVIVKWQTKKLAPSILEYSKDGENFYTIKENILKKEHELLLTGLDADTKYSYSIFALNKKKSKDGSYKILENRDDAEQFQFSSLKEKPEIVSVWVLGDPGVRGDRKLGRKIHKTQLKVRKEFFNYLHANRIDDFEFIIALGDNAYSHGTLREYKKGFFEPYSEILPSYSVYSAFGNHDGGIDKKHMTYSARSYPSPRGVYYDLFSLPGNEVYYSFDRGEVHFVFLDSFDSLWENLQSNNFEKVWTDKSSAPNKMLDWLKQDLKQNKKTWTVVCFHHPPFGQTELIDEKTQDIWKAWTNAYIAPVLHESNVDLVLMGHIHNYQRSYPLRLERNDLDRSKLKAKSKIKKDKKHFVEKYIKLLDELKLPRYLPIASSTEKKSYTKEKVIFHVNLLLKIKVYC